MTLYLYKTGTAAPVLTIENVQSYTAERVTALDNQGNVVTYAPLAEDCELSGKADCSETLRQAWQEAHPGAEAVTLDLLADHEERICMLELTTDETT